MDTPTQSDEDIYPRLKDLFAIAWPIIQSSCIGGCHKLQDDLTDTLRMLLQAARPVLPVPATKGEFLAAFDKLREERDRIGSILRPMKDTLFTALKHEHDALKQINTQYLELCERISDWTSEIPYHKTGTASSHQFHLNNFVRELEQKVCFWVKNMNLEYAGQLQEQVQMMVEDQSDEMKQWVVEICDFNTHLELEVPEKPGFELEPKSQSRDLPLEMMCIIYSLADLETCVNLRQVSSSWFAAYHHINIWEQKLNERNPWFKLDEKSSDSVLVFVNRLKKWTVTDSIDDIKVAEKTARMKCVFAERLKRGQKLSPDFQSLTKHAPGCWTTCCEQLHLRDLGSATNTVVNLWTLEETTENQSHEVVSTDGSCTCIDFQGVQIEVPFERQQLRDSFAVKIGPCTISVTANGGKAVVLPRYDPRADAGIVFTSSRDLYHLQDAFLQKNQSSTVSIADFTTKNMHPYATSETAIPVSSYNGSIWWALKKRCIMPTLIDLQNPGIVYYNPKLAVVGSLHDGFQQGSKHSGSERFIVCSPARTQDRIHVFDLATGIITAVKGRGVHQFILGFQNNQFRPFMFADCDSEEYHVLPAPEEEFMGEDD